MRKFLGKELVRVAGGGVGRVLGDGSAGKSIVIQRIPTLAVVAGSGHTSIMVRPAHDTASLLMGLTIFGASSPTPSHSTVPEPLMSAFPLSAP